MLIQEKIYVPHKDFEKEIMRKFETIFPKISKEKKFSLKDYGFIQTFEKMLYNFDLVYANREAYNLDRAFKQTSNTLHRIFETTNNGIIIDELMILRSNLEKEHPKMVRKHSDKIDSLFFDIKEWEASKEITLVKKANRFKILSQLIMTIDIIISIILILLISEFGHVGELYFSNRLVVGSIFVAIVLLKVILDRFVIIPWIDRLGWKWYKKLTRKTRTTTIKIIVFFLFLNRSNTHYDPLETVGTLSYYREKIRK